MRKLLTVASLGEIAFGLLLLAVPTLGVRLLLATSISGSAVTIGRVAGAGLIVLGIGCRPRGESRRELDVMLVYSAFAACALVIAGLRGSAGILLWPAVVGHGATALLLWTKRPRKAAM